MNESAGGSLKSDSMSCVRPGASLTHASRPVRGGRPGWQLQHRVHDQDQWESEEGELMQLTVETKMSTAMEVRQWGRVKIGFCKNGVDCAAAAMLLVSDLVSAACLVTLASNSWLEARP